MTEMTDEEHKLSVLITILVGVNAMIEAQGDYRSFVDPSGHLPQLVVRER